MVIITLFHTHLFYFKCPSNYYLCILNTYLVSNDVKHELCALHRGISGTISTKKLEMTGGIYLW